MQNCAYCGCRILKYSVGVDYRGSYVRMHANCADQHREAKLKQAQKQAMPTIQFGKG